MNLRPEPPSDVKAFVTDIDLPLHYSRVVTLEWHGPKRQEVVNEQYAIEIMSELISNERSD